MKRTGRYTIHPQSISIIPATVRFGVLLQFVDKYWQLGGVPFFFPLAVNEYQINTGRDEFAGRVRNKKLTNFYPCDNSMPVGGKY